MVVLTAFTMFCLVWNAPRHTHLTPSNIMQPVYCKYLCSWLYHWRHVIHCDKIDTKLKFEPCPIGHTENQRIQRKDYRWNTLIRNYIVIRCPDYYITAWGIIITYACYCAIGNSILWCSHEKEIKNMIYKNKRRVTQVKKNPSCYVAAT